MKMTMIPTCELEMIIRQLGRAEYYCAHAKSSLDPTYDPHDEPTCTYPGASGYAGATMRSVLETLEAHTN